jgi:benzylsuccinate CoA-transferase BbsF subunit
MAAMPDRPFAGLRIVDFTGHVAGPAVTKMLADYGAEVIVIESETYLATSGGSRHSGPPGMSSVNTAYMHNTYNSNKLSVTLDLTRPRGRALVREIIAVSDIFAANRLPAFLKKFELTYDDVRAIRPDIIYFNMPTMGAGGPRSFYKGVGWTIQAMAGLNTLSGYGDRPPASPTPGAYPDATSNPWHTAVALLAALRHRGRTGRGQQIELSQYESTVCWTGPSLLEYAANGRVMSAAGNDCPGAVPHDVYRCRGDDRWCTIAAFTEEQWRAICRTIGRPELATFPEYATPLARRAHAEGIRAAIEAWTGEREPEEVMRAMQAAGIPCAAVNDYRRLLDDPQLQARQAWTEDEHPELGKILVQGWGFQISGVSPAATRAPLLGEHNDYVLQGVLGLSEETINSHIVDGVLR